MTFDKYNGKITGWGNTVFPNNGYNYNYKIVKGIGWCQIKGKKLSDLPKQKWDIKIPKEVKQ